MSRKLEEPCVHCHGSGRQMIEAVEDPDWHPVECSRCKGTGWQLTTEGRATVNVLRRHLRLPEYDARSFSRLRQELLDAEYEPYFDLTDEKTVRAFRCYVCGGSCRQQGFERPDLQSRRMFAVCENCGSAYEGAWVQTLTERS